MGALTASTKPSVRVPRKQFMAARRWAFSHPCSHCGGYLSRETFYRRQRLVRFTCRACGARVEVAFKDAGVLV